MNKELKRSYECLDLPFSATSEDVKMREKALIKIYNNKSVENGNSHDKEIGEIEKSAKIILENLKKNGQPKEVHSFDSSWHSIIILLAVLFFVGLLCFFSFYVLL